MAAQTPRSLGSLGGADTLAFDINDAGQIVGDASTDTTTHAFLWTAAEGMTDLGTLPGFAGSFARKVSEGGQVVGFSSATGDEDSPYQAFSWTRRSGMINLAAASHVVSSAAVGVNRQGQVAGDAEVAIGVFHAFSWTAVGGMIDVGTLGGRFSSASALNARGEVTGESETAAGEIHAFVWTASQGLHDLGSFSDHTSGLAFHAAAINAHGQVVGSAATADGSHRAFSWTPAGGMRDLGTLGGTNSVAADVNVAGTVVGYSDAHDGTAHAFVWTRAGGLLDLGPGAASAVNERNQVVGETTTGGVTRAWMWIAGARIGLRPLAGADSFADRVNDSGQVIGGSFSRGASRATLWAVTSTILRPTADAYVRAGAFAATNFGFAPHLDVKKGASPDNTRRAYVKFDISHVSEGEVVTLGLTGHVSATTGGPVTVTLYAAGNAPWDERTLTWSTRPALGAVLGSVQVAGTTRQSLQIDLTEFIQSERRAGRTVVSVALRSSMHSTPYSRFDSREAGPTGPALVITPQTGR